MLRQQVIVNAWFVVEAFQKTGGHQSDQVAVAFGIFAQQDEMVGAALGHIGSLSGGHSSRAAIRLFRAAIVTAGSGHVNFAADNRLYAARDGFVMKLLGGKEIAVIGDSYCGHALVGGFIHQFGDIACAVEKTVIGMQV